MVFSRRKISIKADILFRNKGQKQCNDIFNKLKRKTTRKLGFSIQQKYHSKISKKKKKYIYIYIYIYFEIYLIYNHIRFRCTSNDLIYVNIVKL